MIKFQMGTDGLHNMSEGLEGYGSVDNKGSVKRVQVGNWNDQSVLEMNSEDKPHKENNLLNELSEVGEEDEYGTENNGTSVVKEQVKGQDKAETAVAEEQPVAENTSIRSAGKQDDSQNNGLKVAGEQPETLTAEGQVFTEKEEFRDAEEKDKTDITAEVLQYESENMDMGAVKVLDSEESNNEESIAIQDEAKTETTVAEEHKENENKEISGEEEKAESNNICVEQRKFENDEIKVTEEKDETGNLNSIKDRDAKHRTIDEKLDQDDQPIGGTHSSFSDISRVDGPDVGLSPGRGLDHCVTAPIGTIGTRGHSLTDIRDINLFRSRTQKGGPFDRLSEREKKKLIVELVKIQKDGTVEVDLTKTAPVASELLELHALERAPFIVDDFTHEVKRSVPKLKITMLVVGTRGDVQPFLAMAKRLQEFGHHVRLATHINFKEFVKSAGVEFYPLGGDPRVLAGYMARNKGFIPSGPGEISAQRKQMKQIIESLLPACTEPDIETGSPFNAQAIIANPPAYGHAHVAEALGVPIHIFFTMPWTPTYDFPHPLARVPQSAGNWLSYTVVDLLIWWGIRSYINDFRKRKLKLAPIAYFSMYSGSISHLPTGYMWSPHVVPKPNDWGPSVDVVGYCFLNLGAKYEPREEFVKWISQGSKPIYIGFGSMPLEDPKGTTTIILEALKETGQRGILDRGWGDLGIFSEVPDNIFLLENCPHDWLFPQCFAVVHHGGAGTTATGLKAGCPTTVVPFFGDQFFWGDRIRQKELGPEPIPITQLSVENLSNAIRYMLQDEVKSRVMEIAKLIENEDGVATAVDAFHRNLPEQIPLPASNLDENDHPTAVQWVFSQIGRVCCLPCS